MWRSPLTLLLVPAAVLFVVGNLLFFTVDEAESAVVLQFGRPVRALTTPGLQWKWPEPVQSVQRFNKRIQVYASEQAEYLTRDKKNVAVEYYVAWRIADPVAYLIGIGGQSAAETRLADLVGSALGVALGQLELPELVTTEPGRMRLPQLTADVTRAVDAQARGYGLEVADVKIKLLTFPDKNKASVFARMKAEREAMARQYRSEGSQEAARIRAEAEREEKVILSEAYSRAETLRGEGDAEAIRIYAEAFGQDPEFYQFLRTLEAYDKFIDDKTTVVLQADSDLLKYLNRLQAAPAAAEPQSTLSAPRGATGR